MSQRVFGVHTSTSFLRDLATSQVFIVEQSSPNYGSRHFVLTYTSIRTLALAIHWKRAFELSLRPIQRTLHLITCIADIPPVLECQEQWKAYSLDLQATRNECLTLHRWRSKGLVSSLIKCCPPELSAAIKSIVWLTVTPARPKGPYLHGARTMRVVLLFNRNFCAPRLRVCASGPKCTSAGKGDSTIIHLLGSNGQRFVKPVPINSWIPKIRTRGAEIVE